MTLTFFFIALLVVHVSSLALGQQSEPMFYSFLINKTNTPSSPTAKTKKCLDLVTLDEIPLNEQAKSYLEKNLYPFLTKGLTELSKAKPENPAVKYSERRYGARGDFMSLKQASKSISQTMVSNLSKTLMSY